ncbi:MAG: RluA family pseudouridine synthase [Betaproteobacteria bacterium]|nr:RluA family pseudouridine synthase [Betaproteobacteria bacterium]MBV9359777.1 RluA family pseudouridine synthase [Betaproteobacteria bacterium]
MKDLNKPASRPQVQNLEIGEENAAQRIDNFLIRILRGVPKSHVYRVLRSGEVRVNSGRVGPDYRLQLGDRVRVPPVRVSTDTKAPPKPAEFPIAHEDASILVVDKPAGVAVHGGSGVSYGVIESLRASRPQTKFLELAHRLDRDTSGLLIVCKKRSALVELHRQLREGEVEKIYAAIVKGVPARDAFEISEPLHKHVTGAGERRVSVKEGGMSALTRVKVSRKGRESSLLEIRLLTGRTHQIRVHLAHAGHPVLGDDKYGDFELNRSLTKRGVKRLFLHARKLAFDHPLEKVRLRLESPMPGDMKAFAETL